MKFLNSNHIQQTKTEVYHQSAGGVVIYSKNHILKVALLQKKDGRWVIPKGHIKKSENPQEAALREIKEELSIGERLIKNIGEIGVNAYHFTLPGDNRIHYKKVHLFVFLAIKELKLHPLLEEGFNQAQWFNFDEALNKATFDKENLLKARELYYFQKKRDKCVFQKISFCVSTHNGGRRLFEMFSSLNKNINLIDSNNIQIETIICLDHCTDNTEKICQLSIKKFPKFKIRIIQNLYRKGKALAMNALFESATGEIIFFLDDDIILTDTVVKSLLRKLSENKQIKIVYPQNLPLLESFKSSWEKFWWNVFSLKFRKDIYARPDPYLVGRCTAIPRECYIQLPNLLNEDQFFQIMYHPFIEKENEAIIFFHSVSTLKDYFTRFIRIGLGKKQIKIYFSKERLNKFSLFSRDIAKNKIAKLSPKDKLFFYTYRSMRFIANIIFQIYSLKNKSYEWQRIKY